MTTGILNDLEARFWSKTRIEPLGCIRWQGSIRGKGYGNFWYAPEKKSRSAHSVAWFLHYGVWPKEGRELDHLCRNRWCVNVEHLEEVTRAENQARGINLCVRRDSTKCAKVLHEWIPENIKRWKNVTQCRLCINEAQNLRRIYGR